MYKNGNEVTINLGNKGRSSKSPRYYHENQRVNIFMMNGGGLRYGIP